MGEVIFRIRHTQPPDHTNRADLPTPMIVKDIEPYRSPVDGRVIGGRAARREDLARNGCAEWEPSLARGKRVPGTVVNPKYFNSGLKPTEEARETFEKNRKVRKD